MNKKLLAALIPFTFLSACSTVEADERGIFTNFGSVEGPVLPGLQWYNPFTTSLEVLSTAPKKWDSSTMAYTSDFQNAKIDFTVTYQLDPSKVKDIWVSAKTEWDTRFIPPVVESAIKQIIGKTTAIALIQNRAASEDTIKSNINSSLKKRGIIISEFSVRNVEFSQEFEKAVERKQVAVENAQASKNQTVQIEEQAKQRIISAEADAKAMQIKSQALSTNPGLAQYEAVQKWDGVLPVNMYGNVIPFVPIK
jgi:prohibitin 2